MDHSVYVISVTEIGRDTRRIAIERPKGYEVRAGEATDVAVDEDGWWDQVRPFHFRRTDDPDFLEFVVRLYGDADPVQRRLAAVRAGDRLRISRPWAEDLGVFFGGWRRPAAAAHVARLA